MSFLPLLLQSTAPDSGALPFNPNWLLLGIAAIFYFMIWRPASQQRTKQKEMLGKLKKGDEVVTTGGIFGRIASIGDDEIVTLEIAKDVRIRVRRSAIETPSAAAEEKAVEGDAKK